MRCLVRRLSFLLVLLISATYLVAQTHVIVPNGRVELLDGSSRRGDLLYRVSLEGGTDRGSNTYDFAEEEKAVLRIDVRIEARNRSWQERAKVGFGSKSFQFVRQGMWKQVGGPKMIDADKPYQTFVFETVRPGSAGIVLPFTFLDTDDLGWDDEKNWLVSQGKNTITTPKITIKGLPDLEDKEWLTVRGKLKPMIAYVLDPTRGTKYVGEARTMIDNRTDTDYRNLVTESAEAGTVQKFVTAYAPFEKRGFPTIDRRLKMARDKMTATYSTPAVEPKPEVKRVVPRTNNSLREAQSSWTAAIASRDTALLGAYLSEFAGLVPENDLEAADSLVCWPEANYRVLGKRGGREEIELLNFATPAYYDIYGDWLDVDDRKLREENIVSVAVRRSGTLTLRIVDVGCPGKLVDIALDNLMNAELTRDTLAGTYRITFEGGTPPYRLRLTNDDPEGSEWSRGDIASGEVIIEASALSAAGLTGSYRAEAFSAGAYSPVIVQGGKITVVEAGTPTWLLVVLTLLVFGGLAILLLYILRRGGRQQRTIFDDV